MTSATLVAKVKTNDKKGTPVIQTLTRAAFNNIPARDSSKYKYQK
jgi:hypothetical protein